MQSSERIKQYCDEVKKQIRWKKAREAAVSEIEDHILDQRDAYINEGCDEDCATKKAILQMGDAEMVGAQLDKCYKPRPQWLMLSATAILFAIGMLVNFYIDSLPESLNRFDPLGYIPAFAALVICYFLDFSILGKNPRAVYFQVLSISWVIWLYAYFSKSSINGRLYWFAGGFSVSLSYMALIFPLAYALFVYSMKGRKLKGIVCCNIAYTALAVVLMLIPSMCGLIVFTISAFTLLCFAVCRNWFEADKRTALAAILIPFLTVLLFAVYFIFFSHNERLSVFFAPEKYIGEAGYQYAYLRGIIGNAKLIGQGAVSPDFKEAVYLENKFLLSFIAHRFGVAALLAVIILGIAIFAASIYKSLKEKSALGSLVSLSIILTIASEMLLSVFEALGYGLISSFEFPFISYGRLSLIINSALMGFMLSIFRTGEFFNDGLSIKEKNGFISFKDGRFILDINFKKSGQRA